MFFAAVALAACAGSQDEQVFGDGADRFFQAWVDDWQRGDHYATVRFYTPDVAVRLAQPDLELTFAAATLDATTQGDGRAWLARFISTRTRPTQRELRSVFVDDKSAAVLVTLTDLNTAAIFQMTMEEGLVAEQQTLRWRHAYKPGGVSDPRLDWVDELIETYLETQPGQLTVTQLSAGGKRHPAVFVTPSASTAIVSLVVTDASSTCRSEMLVTLHLDGRSVVADERAASTGSGAECAVPDPGWWTDISIPEPLSEQKSGTAQSPNGQAVTVFNGSPDLHRLVEWGLGRFQLAGLEPPPLGSVTFGPVPQCDGIAGLVEPGEDGTIGLIQCLDAYDLCDPEPSNCVDLRPGARFSFLHELAHAWMLANPNEERTDRFTAERGLAVWEGTTVPWHERAVEHAAEIIAWGLMDEDMALARIGDPPCESLETGFTLMVAVEPPRACP